VVFRLLVGHHTHLKQLNVCVLQDEQTLEVNLIPSLAVSRSLGTNWLGPWRERSWTRSWVPPGLHRASIGAAVRDPLGCAYNRTAHLAERKKMMQAWADYLDGLRLNSTVVPIRRLAGCSYRPVFGGQVTTRLQPRDGEVMAETGPLSSRFCPRHG